MSREFRMLQGRAKRRGAWGQARQCAAPALAAVLLLAGATAHAASTTRTSAFDYNGVTGLLTKEIVEPDNSDFCLVTAHGYDAWGHKTSATTRNCNGSAGSSPSVNSEAAAPATGTAPFASRSSSTTYSSDGRFPVTSSNALGQSETTAYDSTLGAPTRVTGPNLLSTEWKYDAFGRKVLEKRADGNGTAWTYAYCSGIAGGSATCPTIAGATSVYVVTATPVSGPIDVSAGTTGAANGPYSKTYTDALGRVLRVESQGWDGAATRQVFQDTEYNNLGQVVRSSQPYFAGATSVKWVVTAYDWIGRARVVTQPDGSKSTSTYQGLTISVTDDLGRVTKQRRNEADQLIEITDPHLKTLTRTYDAYGNLLTTTDSLGNVTELRYDTRGRKFQMTDPDMGTWTYGYNALGEMVRQVDAKGQVTQLTYDLLGRLVAKTEPSLNVNWYYDKYQDGSACAKGIGKLCETVAGNGHRRKHSFDSLGRVQASTAVVGANTYNSGVTYDSNGRINTVTYPGAALTVQNQYVPTLGLLQQIVNAANPNVLYWKSTAVDAEGRLTGQQYGNGVTTTNVFHPQSGRLTQTLAGANNAVQNISYGYDTIGNLTSRSDAITGVAATYQYDSLNRLKTEQLQGGALASAQTTTWIYDDIGNISSRSDIGTYVYNPSGAGSVRPHAVASISGAVNGKANPSYLYDANGNLSSVKLPGGVLRNAVWNSYNKADSISRIVDGVTYKLDFLYDGDGDRAREVFTANGAVQRTTHYLNAGAGLVYEEETIGANTKKKHYLNGPGGAIGVLTLTGTTWSTQYWHVDHLGSPTVITDESGAVAERLAYEPFGKRRNANGLADTDGTLKSPNTRRGFTTHEHSDAVGLVNMNGRWFDQSIGRFISADPTVQTPTYGQSYNRYAYLWNSPLNGTDPTGYAGNFFANLDGFSDRLITVSHAAGGDFPASYAAWRALTGKYGAQVKVIGAGVGCGFISFGALAIPCAAAASASIAKAYGASDHDALRAGAVSAATAYAMYAVGSATGGASPGMKLANVAGHAAVGCASAAASGGTCRSGALAGGFSAAATNFAPNFAQDKIYGGVYAAVTGGIGSVLGGGKFANGAVTGTWGYLFNYLRHSPGAKGYLDELRASSPSAAQMLDALEADKSTTYYFDVGPLPESTGGGTVRIQRQERSLWERALGRTDALSVTVIATVDPRSTVSFTDVNGQIFQPDTLRLMAHELGHAFTWYQTGGNFVTYRASSNAAVGHENVISRQRNPNAPIRAVSDHGGGRP